MKFQVLVDGTRERSLSDQPQTTTEEDPWSREQIVRERATSLITPKDKYPAHWKKKNNENSPRKSSSTATIFLDSTIYTPKHNEIMRR